MGAKALTIHVDHFHKYADHFLSFHLLLAVINICNLLKLTALTTFSS